MVDGQLRQASIAMLAMRIESFVWKPECEVELCRIFEHEESATFSDKTQRE
jgi:hypothetical protein